MFCIGSDAKRKQVEVIWESWYTKEALFLWMREVYAPDVGSLLGAGCVIRLWGTQNTKNWFQSIAISFYAWFLVVSHHLISAVNRKKGERRTCRRTKGTQLFVDPESDCEKLKAQSSKLKAYGILLARLAESFTV